MDFLIEPLEMPLQGDCKNGTCPTNKEQCGCNTVALCACPQR